MTIKELLNQGIIMLKNEDIDGPKNKARAILQHTLKKSREYLIIYDNKEVTNVQRDEYVKNIKRLIAGEPLQYITGVQEFMKLNFVVTKDVLIPQPDTEILVEEVIKIANRLQNPYILDLCTGSGAIAVSLAKNIPNVKIVATDISKKALEIAKYNAKLNGVLNNIDFIESNLFQKIKNIKFDIIVSNPPYIVTSEINKLPKDVRQEPIIALDGGKDGLDFYRKIYEKGHDFLNRQGYLCVEIGYNQKEAVKKIIEGQKRYVETYCKKDLCENDRVIVTQIG
ncbi:MAG: peptide chain release factor N(5)-glutamine methyltransferase [Clostridia bacterium]|nr:peptide chain release factor N(5)-glutamine methyltransferase [Clostridia bacterium]